MPRAISLVQRVFLQSCACSLVSGTIMHVYNCVVSYFFDMTIQWYVLTQVQRVSLHSVIQVYVFTNRVVLFHLYHPYVKALIDPHLILILASVNMFHHHNA